MFFKKVAESNYDLPENEKALYRERPHPFEGNERLKKKYNEDQNENHSGIYY